MTLSKNKYRLLFLFQFVLSIAGFSEGVKDLCPDSTISSADLFLDNGSYGVNYYTRFALISCLPNNRLYIHVKNVGETILFGMNCPYSLRYNLRKPDGTVALTGNCPGVPLQTGFIRYFRQATIGPFPSLGGYVPLGYTVTSIADTGNFYFEFLDLPWGDNAAIARWDFQVVSGLHTPAIPADMINGRVWSQSWQINAELSYMKVFNGSFFVYADDGIVTKMSFSNARIGAATIFCNPYGCLNTGNFITDRKSQNVNTYSIFPGIAQYKVFLNNPDSSLYPNGFYGQITNTPFIIPDPAYPVCSGNKEIVVAVNKTGKLEIVISFPYGGTSTSVAIYADVIPGTNVIDWDGKDGLGNPVPDGTLTSVTVNYLNGLTNLPIFDQEQNPNGYQVSLIRPVNPSGQLPLLFWDDTGIPAGSSCPSDENLIGCQPGTNGCHSWSGFDCHDKMVNTWWFGSTNTVTFTSVFTRTPPDPIGHGNSRCGPGILTIRASVLPNETVDWYATATGGIPLLVGDSLFTTPFLANTTTFFAEARSVGSSCLSSARVPVVAEILPLPMPSIAGSDSVCLGAPWNLYMTEPGMFNYTWLVSPGGLILAGLGTRMILVRWTTAGINTVSVVYSDTNGCFPASPTLMPVVVNAYAVPSITGDSTVCINSGNQDYYTESGMSDYNWNISPGGNILTGQATDHVQVSWIESGPQWLTVSYTNILGCSTSTPSIKNILVNLPPDAAGMISGPSSVCTGTSGVLYTTDSIGLATSYSWTLPAGSYIVSGAGTNSILVNFSNEAVSGNILVFATNNCGDGLPSPPFPVTVVQKPNSNAGPDGTICQKTSFMITGATVTGASGILWRTNGEGTLTNETTLTPTYMPSPSETGVVIMTLIVTGNLPCGIDSSSMSLNIISSPVVNAGENLSICESSEILISGSDAANFESLTWTTTGNGTFGDPATLHPVYFPGEMDKFLGSVRLILTANPVFPCQAATDTITLRLDHAPMADAGTDGSSCPGVPFTVSGSSASNFSTILWSSNGAGYLTDETSLTPAYHPYTEETGVVTLTMNVTGTDACSTTVVSDQMTILIDHPVVVDAGPNQTIPYNTGAKMNGKADGSPGPFDYSWEPAEFFIDSSTPYAVTIQLTSDVTLRLYVTDLKTGCTGADTTRIKVDVQVITEECLVFHNVITPNGDGVNDFWFIECIENFPYNKVDLFDRWGDKVSTIENYNNTTRTWKGEDVNAKILPDGTYYYVLTLKDGGKHTGWVFIRGGSR